MIAATAVVIAAALTVPVGAPRVQAYMPVAATSDIAVGVRADPTRHDFEPLLQLELQRPLVDPPPPPPPPPPALNLTLTGTAGGSSDRQGLFVGADGTIQLKGPGESVGSTLILEVGSNWARVSHFNHEVTIYIKGAGVSP